MRFLFILLLFPAAVSSAQEPASGRWVGLIKITNQELKVVVDLARQDKDHWIGSITLPDLNIKGAPLTDITAKDSSVSFAINNPGPIGLNAKFNASLTPTDKMQGDFVEGGNTAPFALTKTGPAQVEPWPHSTTVLLEFVGEWKGDYELGGYSRHVTIKLANQNNVAIADFVIVGKKNNILPVDLIEQNGNRISIESHQVGITFEGRLNKAANEINATLTQGPIELNLTVRRTQ
jgi:hypothetical protein